ncbi:MAG: hypothetical protein ACJ76H_06830 [Bacteriovoracaceae bacterium]
MRSLLVPVLLVLTACSTPKGLDPARLPAQVNVELDREISMDFNHDNIEDSVKLLPPKNNRNYHVLEISVSDGKGFRKFENDKLVYAFSNPGASLEDLDNGSFKVIIDHSGAGRSSSLREYTISYRDEKFILSGVTVSEYDRLDPNIGGSCDINLLTGKGERNSHAIKIKPAKRDLNSVNFEWLPKECKF